MVYLIGVCLLMASIVVHELGHLIAALSVGCAIEEFSVFMGPPLVKCWWKNIQFTIRLLPIGGYVSFMQKDIDIPLDGERYFEDLNWGHYSIITLAGVASNVAAGVLVLWAVACLEGAPPLWSLGWAVSNSVDFFASIIDYFMNVNPLNVLNGDVIMVTKIVGEMATSSPAGAEEGGHQLSKLYVIAETFWTLNLGLALINILPVPPLDGFFLTMRTVEAILQRRINPKVVGFLGYLGLGLLMALTIKDTIAGLLTLVWGS